MKKLLSLITCIVLIGLAVLPSIHAENIIPKLELDDFKIAGFHLTQPISEIVAKLGQPVKSSYDQKSKYKMYYYSNMTIGFFTSDKNLDSIVVKDPKLKTFRGIGIGDKETDVIHKYGNKKMWGNEYVYQLWHPSFEWGPYAISFVMKEGIVAQIKIYFAAD